MGRVVLAMLGAVLFFSGCYDQSGPRLLQTDLHLYRHTEPFSMDPRVGGDSNSQIILRELFEGLTRYGKGGPELALAESVSISEDQTQYTFHLRPSTWSNGQNVTSLDFEYAWKSVIRSSLFTNFSYAFFVIKNAQKACRGECSVDDVGISCPDDQTLQVILEHPAPYFLQWTANPIYSPVCRAVVEKNREWTKDCFPEYVCNGPFILKEHVLNSHIVLEKNKEYWNKDSVKSDRIEFAIVEDDITAYNLFCAGKLDWYGAPFIITMPSEVAVQLSNEKKLRCVQTSATLQLDCCTKKLHLASQKIRKALAQAIDRKELVHHLYCDAAVPATSIVPQWLSLLASPLFEDGNPQEARRLFEEGITELGITREAYPQLTLFCDSRLGTITEAISQQISKALGISVVTKLYERQTFYQKVEASEHDLVIQSWVSWLQDPIYNLDSYKFRNNRITYTCWQNEQYIKLLDASDAATDTQKRQQFLAEAEALLMTELPTIPLFYMVDTYAKSPDVDGDSYSYFDIPELKGLEKKNPSIRKPQ
jgi:oligopeptide transport system substrate-binding protein